MVLVGVEVELVELKSLDVGVCGEDVGGSGGGEPGSKPGGGVLSDGKR